MIKNCVEKDMRDMCLEYLQRRGFFMWRDKQVTGRPSKGVDFKESKGCPDIIGMTKEGRFVGIEIKKPGGVLSVEQHEFLDRIKSNGGYSCVVTNLDDLIFKMKEFLK